MEIVDDDENDEDNEETEINEDNDIYDTSRRYTCPIAPRLQSIMPNTHSSSINIFDSNLKFIGIIILGLNCSTNKSQKERILQVRYRPYNNILPTSKKFMKQHIQKSIEIQTESKDNIKSNVRGLSMTIKQEQDAQTSKQPRVYGSGFNKPRIRIKTDLTITPENRNTQLLGNSETTTDS